MCFKFKVTIAHCPSIVYLTQKQALIGHLCHRKNQTIKCFPSLIHLPLCPTLPISPERKGKSCLSEQKGKADLTATRTICQTIWFLSSPDSREDGCVRKNRELRTQSTAFLSQLLPFPRCACACVHECVLAIGPKKSGTYPRPKS